MVDAAELDERQTRVVDALQLRSPKLAGVYRTALGTLAAPSMPGCESARVAVICHCMREVMNRIADIMSDMAIPRPKPSSGALAARLPELLAAHPETDLGLQQDLIPVPQPVARAVQAISAAATKERGRNLAVAAAFINGGTDPASPVIAQWRSAQQFFLGWAHLDRKHDEERTVPADDELLDNIRVVEDVIEVRSALFFDNLHALESLLAEANAEDDEVDR